jgi:hypothetical protein
MIATSNKQQATSNKQQATSKFKFKFLTLLTLLFSSFIFGQNSGFDGKLSPNGLLENVFDRFGNSYLLSDLKINQTGANASTLIECNSSSYFKFYYEVGSGLEYISDPIHIARREVICKVFADLSKFINSPLTNTNKKVNIVFRNFKSIDGFLKLGQLGVGSGFYNIPKNTNRFASGGIIENEVYKTIHLGNDSFKNVAPPIVNSLEIAENNGQFYHGLMAIDFTQQFNLDVSSNGTLIPILNPTNQFDLYSLVLRIAMHTLGITSLIGVNGNSVFGAENNYYSRYDSHLIYEGQNLLNHNTRSCSIINDYSFAVSESVLHPECNELPYVSNINSDTTICENAIYYHGETAGNIPVYTPRCFEKGISLSNFEDALYPDCNAPYGNNSYFVMSNNLPINLQKRHFQPEERLAMCELGYSLNATFNGFNYKTETCAGINVAAANDGFNNENSFTNYGDENSTIAINNVLLNDINYQLGNNNIADLRFECLQDVYYPTTTNATTGNESQITISGNDVNATINFKSLVPGIHLLSYVPYDALTGERGNIGYVWVFVHRLMRCLGTPSSNPLEYVINGNFEQNDGGGAYPSAFYFGRVCGWEDAAFNNNGIIWAGSCDYFGTLIPTPIPPLPPSSILQNTYGLGYQTASNTGIIPNDYYAGMGMLRKTLGTPPPSTFVPQTEILKTKLKMPLLPNTQYKLRFEVSLGEGNSRSDIKFEAFLTSVNNNQWTDWSVIPSALLTNNPSNILLVSDHFSAIHDGWDVVEMTFTTSNCSSLQYLYLGMLTATNSYSRIHLPPFPYLNEDHDNRSYYYVDNVSIIPTNNVVINTPTFNLPADICVNTNIPDLNNFISNQGLNGFFTGTGVTNTSSVYSFNPSSLASGNYVITYNYQINASCPFSTITKTIYVSMCAQLFISQVYVVGNNKFIEIKNKSNTQTVPANTYFLLNYPNSLSLYTAPYANRFIPQLLPLQTVIIKETLSTAPAYALANSINFFSNFNFDGINDILIISPFRTGGSTLPFDKRIDLVGDSSNWCVNKSLVRSSCATTPKTTFDLEDWVEFSPAEVADGNSLTNAVLGRHNFDQLRWEGTPPNWKELDLSLSRPDRSRTTFILSDYNTNPTGSFEACSLLVENLIKVTVSPTKFIKVQVSVKVNPGGSLDIQNGGSLVMVKDSYNGVSGPDLVQLDGGTVDITKTTNGVNGFTDYVYWSSPLTSNITFNDPFNRITNLFPPAMSTYERIFNSFNQNYYDGWDTQIGTSGGAGSDGDDDNIDQWHRLNATERNLLMVPGQGYIGYGETTDYNLNFRGQANNGVVNVPVYRNDSSYGDNSNLIGNPYPSPIDLNRLFEVNKDLIDPVAFMWGRTPFDGLYTYPNPTVYGPTSFSEDNYLIYNPTMLLLGNWANNNIPFNVDGILATCQSFFIRTRKLNRTTLLPIIPLDNTGQVDNQLAGNLVFNNSMRSTSSLNTFARGGNKDDNGNKLWINLTNESKLKTAQLGIAFLENGNDDFDSNEDVQAFSGRNLNFYTKQKDKDVLINALSKFNKQKTISLGIVNLLNEKKLSISIDKKTGELKNNDIYLYDNVTSKIFNLTNATYSFETNDKIIENRFTLLFHNKIETEINNEDLNKIIIFSKDGLVTVNSLTEKLIQAVYVSDLYTPNVGGIEIAKNENINNKMFSFKVDSKYKILNIKVLLNDGTVVNKKITP